MRDGCLGLAAPRRCSTDERHRGRGSCGIAISESEPLSATSTMSAPPIKRRGTGRRLAVWLPHYGGQVRPLLRKRQPQPGGEQNVVGLAARNRVAQVTVAHRKLPGEPLPDRRRGGGVEVDAVVAVGWLRIEEQLLLKRHGAAEFVIQFLAHHHRKCGPVQSGRKKFAIAGRA